MIKRRTVHLTIGACVVAFLAMLSFAPGLLSAQVSFTNIAGALGLDDPGFGQGVSFGDFNSDGYEDIYIINHTGQGILYRNNGDGTFTDVTASAGVGDAGGGSEGAIWGDYDNDGDLDLYVTDESAANILFENSGAETFTNVAGARGVADPGTGITSLFADYNRDGLLDIYIVNLTGSNVLLQGQYTGVYKNVTAAAGVGNTGQGITGVSADFDGDGWIDIYVVNRSGANALYVNNGNGTFTDVTAEAGVGNTQDGLGVTAGDYDNDSAIDIYVANTGANVLYNNNGLGVFTDVAEVAGVANMGSSLGTAFGDVDNDGFLDIYVVNADGANALYLNDGDGTFTDIAASAGVEDAAHEGQGTAFGDYDLDGDLDIYVTNGAPAPANEPNVFYRNEGTDNHWIHIKTEGVANNLSGIAAEVTIWVNGVAQRRDVEGGSGFSSQNSLPVEFGLGIATVADSVRVNWPIGNAQMLYAIQADTVLVVTEVQFDSDLAVVQIFGPPDDIEIVQGDSLVPSALLRNHAVSAASDFSVNCLIETGGVAVYEDTVSFIGPFASLDTLRVTFSQWVPATEDTFLVTFVLLFGDENSINDTLTSTSSITFARSPQVTVTSPEDGAVNVPVTLPIITATVDVDLDAATVNSETVVVNGSTSGPIPGSPNYFASPKRIAYIVDSGFDFAFDEVVTVTLTGEILSVIGLGLDGNGNGESEGSPIDDFAWEFTTESPVGILPDGNAPIPTRYNLGQNYPNPFNPTTEMQFALPTRSHAILIVYNTLGKEIVTLVDAEYAPGYHSVTWNASSVASGIYFYRLQAGEFTATRKMLLLK